MSSGSARAKLARLLAVLIASSAAASCWAAADEGANADEPGFQIECAAGTTQFQVRLPHAFRSLEQAAGALAGALPGTPSRPSAPRASSTGVYVVRWAPASGPSYRGLAYELQRSTGGGNFRTVAWVRGSFFRESGLPQGLYTYRVRAITNSGSAGQFSNLSGTVLVDRTQPVISVQQDAQGAYRFSCAKEGAFRSELVKCGLDSSGGVIAEDAAGNRARESFAAFVAREDASERLSKRGGALRAEPSALVNAFRRDLAPALVSLCAVKREAKVRLPADDAPAQAPGALSRTASARAPPARALCPSTSDSAFTAVDSGRIA